MKDISQLYLRYISRAIAHGHKPLPPSTLDRATHPTSLLTRHGKKDRHFMMLHICPIGYSVHTFPTNNPNFHLYKMHICSTIRFVNTHQHHIVCSCQLQFVLTVPLSKIINSVGSSSPKTSDVQPVPDHLI